MDLRSFYRMGHMLFACLLTGAVGTLGVVSLAHGQSADSLVEVINHSPKLEAIVDALAHLPPHLRKIDMKMLDAIVRMRREGITNANALEHNVKERYATSSLKIDNAGYVHLEIYMKTINSESVDQLTSAGARVEYVNSRFSRIVCYLSFDVIEEMSHNDNIRCFVCVQEPILSVGSYTSVGDSILEADLARTSFNVTGQNTKLGGYLTA